MSFIEIVTIFASAGTMFGLVVGVFSVHNGRMTRREIAGLIRETQANTQALIAHEAEATRQLLRETQADTQALIAREAEANREILQRLTEILERIDARVR
jgi:hypothetical protein